MPPTLFNSKSQVSLLPTFSSTTITSATTLKLNDKGELDVELLHSNLSQGGNLQTLFTK
jgi:hypothetical protein